MERGEGVIEMRGDFVGPCWMVAPRSYLLDRMTPHVEEIRVHGSVTPGGQVRYACGPLVAGPPSCGGAARALRRLREAGPRRLEKPGLIVDLRRRSPGNWAHMLTNHLPYVFALAEATGRDWSELTLLLPRETPQHIVGAAELFGLRTHCTDEALEGSGIAFEPEPWHGNRGVRVDWVRTPRVRAALDAAGLQTAPDRSLPRRVFLSRRDSRRLINEAEIAAYFSALGVETLFAEDLAPLDQLRLLAHAELIVAIHGAALAPLLYRPSEVPPSTVVELFPVGHVTLVWRVVAAQVGCRWAGARGRIKPQHVAGGLYDIKKPFVRFSTEDFELDVASLDRALELAALDNPARKAAL
jgi:capsular polysaccharide biosynthesis protein